MSTLLVLISFQGGGVRPNPSKPPPPGYGCDINEPFILTDDLFKIHFTRADLIGIWLSLFYKWLKAKTIVMESRNKGKNQTLNILK